MDARSVECPGCEATPPAGASFCCSCGSAIPKDNGFNTLSGLAEARQVVYTGCGRQEWAEKLRAADLTGDFCIR